MKTIKLPAQNQQLKQGLKVKISGWGVYSKEGSIETADSSTNLMAAYVLVMNFKKCKDNYKRYGVNVDETVQMCTGLKRGGRGKFLLVFLFSRILNLQFLLLL